MANIENYNSNSLVSGTAGNDYILNGGSNSSLEGVTIDAGSGDDTICNDNSDYSKIYAGEGDDSIKNLAWNALHVTIYGGNGNDFIHNTISQASINGGDGNDTIDNSDDCADNGNTTIDGGAGNDSIKNDSPDVTITGGIGNDTVSLYSGAANNLIQYSYGDGNDIINGFNETSTLQIGGGNGTYSSQVSGSDIIVTVVDGKITLVGATSLATVNVEGTKGNLSIPADALKYNGHSYYVFANVADTWESAQAYCESLGGHLAVINNADENSAVYSYAMQSGYSEIFFGLSDAQNEGTWTWVNGEPVTYTNWEKVIDIEPNGGTRENYGSFKSMYTNGEWNDAYFGNSAFICEWDAVSSDSKLITLTEGNDSITNTLEGVTINALGGNDSIFNDNGSQVTIEGGAGNDYIHSGGYFHNSWHEGGSNNSIDGGAGDDYIINDHNSSYVTVNGGAGNDSIHSGGTTSQATLLGGDGNDSISNDGTSNLINCGAGNDSIRNTGSHALIQYTAGDGNDLIEGFNETSTLQIGGGSGTYSTTKSGSDIIVTVGNGKITLAGAASLSAVNISGTDKSTNAWTLDGTTATYCTWKNTLITVSGVKSLDGISLSGSTVTISKSSLNQGTVSINNGYTLALGNDVTRTSTTAAGWSLNGSTSTYKTAATLAGYKLENNQISYVGASGGDKAFTLTGVKNTTGVTVDTSKKTVTLKADNLNKADVTVDSGYSLTLSGVSAPSQTKPEGFDGLTYKTATMSDGYTSSGSKVTYTAASGGEKIFTLTGVKNTTGIAVDTSKKTVTLATDNLNQKKVTVDRGYTLALGSDVNSP